MRIRFALLSVAVILLFTSSANANLVTYRYTGQSFTEWCDYYGAGLFHGSGNAAVPRLATRRSHGSNGHLGHHARCGR